MFDDIKGALSSNKQHNSPVKDKLPPHLERRGGISFDGVMSLTQQHLKGKTSVAHIVGLRSGVLPPIDPDTFVDNEFDSSPYQSNDVINQTELRDILMRAYASDNRFDNYDDYEHYVLFNPAPVKDVEPAVKQTSETASEPSTA
jgi:hypothetical protein